METIEAHVDFLETVTGTFSPRGDDRAKDHLQGKELRAEPKKIQPKDQTGSTLEQDLSSLLVHKLMQENEELRKRLDAIDKNQPSSHGQQGQHAQQDQQRDELDTSSWESIPSRATPTTTYKPPDQRCGQSHSRWNSTSRWITAH